ncbi:MAG TPA: hypothetical protein VIH59_30495, partial [Candidatus Tectomicrobia bacterium]
MPETLDPPTGVPCWFIVTRMAGAGRRDDKPTKPVLRKMSVSRRRPCHLAGSLYSHNTVWHTGLHKHA